MENGKLEENLKVLENQMKAKKAILEEVLQTVEGDKEKANSVKRRKYIRDILNCEVSLPCTKNEIFSVEFINSFRFEHHVITRFQITNHSSDGHLSVRVSTCSTDCSVRWNIFENQSSVNVSPILSSNKQSLLCVAVPSSAFFQSDKISVVIYSTLLKTKSQLLSPSFHSVIEANQTPEAPPEAFISELIDISEGIEVLETKSIEFVDEMKSVEIIQSLFTVFCRLASRKSPDFSIFRRAFPGFLENDFDTWRLFVGADRFDGILLFTQTEEDVERSQVIGKTSSICHKFLNVMNEKCFEN